MMRWQVAVRRRRLQKSQQQTNKSKGKGNKTTNTHLKNEPTYFYYRRISNETACSSNSSCVLQKRKQLHPLATGPSLKSNKPISTITKNSSVKQRVLSAKYLRFKTLQNELNDANYHIAVIKQRNLSCNSLLYSFIF